MLSYRAIYNLHFLCHLLSFKLMGQVTLIMMMYLAACMYLTGICIVRVVELDLIKISSFLKYFRRGGEWNFIKQ